MLKIMIFEAEKGTCTDIYVITLALSVIASLVLPNDSAAVLYYIQFQITNKSGI